MPIVLKYYDINNVNCKGIFMVRNENILTFFFYRLDGLHVRNEFFDTAVHETTTSRHCCTQVEVPTTE